MRHASPDVCERARHLMKRSSEERVDYDVELRLYNAQLRSAYGIARGDRVVDIGCGSGQTTRDAARMAVAGSVLGVDTSEAAIVRARERAREERLGNITFEIADAQVRSFEREDFDVA